MRALGAAKRVKKTKEGFYESEPSIRFASGNLVPDIRAYNSPGKVILNFQNPYGFFAMIILSAVVLGSVLMEPEQFEWIGLYLYLAAWISIPLLFNGLSMAVCVFATAAMRNELKKPTA